MYKHFFKRFFDFNIALVALLILFIPLLIISVWLYFANRKGSPSLEGGVWGRLFFFQERPGKDAKIFKVIKFKTMTDERDADGNLLPDAQRLTEVGRFVRSTSIDELPQLFNVLKGDMSFIGPRPLLVRYLPYYTEREQLRHSVRPGISGWAQVNGRNNITWDKKLECDAYYAENMSLWLDIKIFFMTLYKVVKREGAIADKKENYLDIERKNGKK